MKKLLLLFFILFISVCTVSCGSSTSGDSITYDLDGDGITDASDNCPDVVNPDQTDSDNDGIGNACNDAFTVEVSGTVLDVDGAPVQGAEVTITSDPVTVITDANGTFSATVDVGYHTIVVRYNGVEIYRANFNAQDNNPLTLDEITTAYDPFINSQPVADAGPDQNNILKGSVVTLDGSGSADVDGDMLDYSWSFTSFPAGDSPILSDPEKVITTFTANMAGTYVISLVVNDGTVDSVPDAVTISVKEPVIALETPAHVAAVAGPGKIAISWDQVAGATFYRIYWSYSSGEGTNGEMITVTDETYVHEKLIYGENYYYAVKAFKDTEESTLSDEVTASPDQKEISSVVFPDANLAACIAAAAGGLTYVNELTSLTCSTKGIIDLTGIGWLTSLDYIYLRKNSIVDISELSGLINLQTLLIVFEGVTDVSVLSGLINLQTLNVSYNAITIGVADLVTLINATTIDLTGNPSIPCSDIQYLESQLGPGIVIHDPC